MKTFSRDDLIAELASNLSVRPDGYGTWKVRSYVGYSRNPMAKDSFITHNEADAIGEMDGETYNPQDFDDWYSWQDWEAHGWDEEPDPDDSEVRSLFDEYCTATWADSANSDNYEPYEDRVLRLAEKIVDMWDDGNYPDDVFVGDNGYYIFEDEDEQTVFDENIGYYITQFNKGVYDEFNDEVERVRDGE